MTNPSGEHWWKDAVVYQIYPRSFADSNADSIGDLPGVTSRLGYLAGLGVDAIWLAPFYPSPLVDGGYDITDHRGVDPALGTLGDFDELVSRAHAAGIKVIVDIVPNHTSDKHPWFQEALSSPAGSPARDRYVFHDGRGDGGNQPPSDWRAHFGGSAWQREPDGPQWYLHLFAPEQPDLNWDNPEIRAYYLGTLRFWADRGVDGFRVDAAHTLAKDLRDPLRSQPDLDRHLPTDGTDPLYDRDELHTIYRSWRQVFNEYAPPRMAVAETWYPITDRAFLYARPDELGQVFDFSLHKCAWDAHQLRHTITRSIRQQHQAGGTPTWVLSNHDISRHASRLALPPGADPDDWIMSGGTRPRINAAAGLRRARAATLMMLALPGSPYLYQGEELGLPEVPDLPADLLRDPTWERSGHRRKGRDGARVPLPWTRSGPSLGFGAATAWLPQPAYFSDLSAQAEDDDPDSTLRMYRDAIRLRHVLGLSTQDLVWRHTPPGVTGFDRGHTLRCITNVSGRPITIPAAATVLTSSPISEPGTLPAEHTAWISLDATG